MSVSGKAKQESWKLNYPLDRSGERLINLPEFKQEVLKKISKKRIAIICWQDFTDGLPTKYCF